MLTFLVTLTVVVLSVVGAVAIAVPDPAQPATTRPPKRRDPSAGPRSLPRHRRPAARRGRALPHTLKSVRAVAPAQPVARPAARPGPPPPPVAAVGPGPEFSIPGEPAAIGIETGAGPTTQERTSLTEGWATGRLGQSIWARLRSGVVLTMLLALVGTLLAAGVAGLLVALAVAVRSAVS